MNHDPGHLAAAYLTGMRPRARRRFEAHLLACERCWHEVTLGRSGRDLAQTVRDIAPAKLLEDIRAEVEAAAARQPAGARPSWRAAAAAAVALAIVAGAAVLARPWPQRRAAAPAAPPGVIAAAVASYRAARLPGTAVPVSPAPDLTSIRLRLIGAAAGKLGSFPVTMFAYAAPTGARLTIVRSSEPFPEATQARELRGTDDAWTTRSRGVTIICAQDTHAMLLLGTDTALVRQAGILLNAI